MNENLLKILSTMSDHQQARFYGSLVRLKERAERTTNQVIAKYGLSPENALKLRNEIHFADYLFLNNEVFKNFADRKAQKYSGSGIGSADSIENVPEDLSFNHAQSQMVVPGRGNETDQESIDKESDVAANMLLAKAGQSQMVVPGRGNETDQSVVEKTETADSEANDKDSEDQVVNKLLSLAGQEQPKTTEE